MSVWDVTSGKKLHTIQAHKDRVFAVAAAPDGRHIATGSEDNLALLLETNEYKSAASASGDTDVSHIAFSLDGRHVAFTTSSGSVMAATTDTLTVMQVIRVEELPEPGAPMSTVPASSQN